MPVTDSSPDGEQNLLPLIVESIARRSRILMNFEDESFSRLRKEGDILIAGNKAFLVQVPGDNIAAPADWKVSERYVDPTSVNRRWLVVANVQLMDRNTNQN